MKQDINNLGTYANIAAVWAAYPEGGNEGDYLYIGSVKYRWNKYDQIWENAATVTESTARKLTELYADVLVNNDLRVGGTLYYHRLKGYDMGLYSSLASLQSAHPSPNVGMWAFVVHPSVSGKYQIYMCSTAGEWALSVSETTLDILDFERYEEAIALMQEIANGGKLTGYRAAQSVSDLPTEDVDPTLGWIVGNHLYIYVEEGGDTLDGLYQDCGQLRGEKGEKGPKGNDGVVLDPDTVTIFDSIDDLDRKTDEEKEKMITSGKAAEELARGTNGSMTGMFVFTNGGAIGAGSGIIATSTQFAYSNYVSVVGVNRLRIRLPRWNSSSGSLSRWGIAFYDSSKVYIGGYYMEKYKPSTSVMSIGDTREYIVEVPVDSVFMRTTYFATTSSFYDGDFYCFNHDAAKEQTSELWHQARDYQTDLSDVAFVNGKALMVNSDTVANSTNFAMTDYINIDGASVINVTIPRYSASGGSYTGYGLLFYDAEKIAISGRGIPLYDDDDIHVVLEDIPVPRGAKYLRTTYFKTSFEYYEPFVLNVDGLKPKIGRLSEDIAILNADKEKAFKSEYHFIGSPSVYRSGSTGTGTVSITYAELCSLYDQLVIDNPDTFVRQADFGTDSGGYTLRRYSITFTPVVFGPGGASIPWDENLMGRRRIFVNAGVHGDEPASTYGVYLSVKDILESNADWAVYIKSNFIIDVCPCLNPWGLDNFSRQNANAIDINRDFVNLTQPESQAWAALLQSLPNLHAVIDNHNTVGVSGYLVSGETYRRRYHYSMISAQLASALRSDLEILYDNPARFPYERHQITNEEGQTHWYCNNVLDILCVTSEVPRGDNGTHTNTFKYIEQTKDICINLIMMFGGAS